MVVGLEVDAGNKFVALPAGEAKLFVEHTTTDSVATRQQSAHYSKTYTPNSEDRLTICSRLRPTWSNGAIVVEYRNCL